MTEKKGVSMTERELREWQRGGGMQRRCCSRRDTRGKRGYDGGGGAGMTMERG